MTKSNTLRQTWPSRSSTRLPAVQAGQALLSLRDSGHDLPTALGEVLDNSVEAQASTIRVELRESTNAKGKKLVHEIAISDDGTGMDRDTLWHYPVVGHSTRYMSTSTIGKYGVGAKLAALNFGKRIDVWSRRSGEHPWLHVHFDLDEAIEAERDGDDHGAGIAEPVQELPPENLRHLLPDGSGTLVLWSKVDRLEEGRLAPNFNELRNEVTKDLSRMFRAFLDQGTVIEVNEVRLLPHDPLFVMENTWGDKVLSDHLAKTEGRKSGGRRREHFPATKIWEEEITIAGAGGAAAKVRIYLLPPLALQKRGKGDSELARKLRIPENEGAISFLRRGREISYTNVPRIFPRGVQDPDRYIGIEVSFEPVLDQYFGVRHVKRGVEPQGDLRDKLRAVLKKYLPEARKKLDEHWGAVGKKERATDGPHAAIIGAVQPVATTMPIGRAPQKTEEQVADELADLAEDAHPDASEQEKKEYIEKTKALPFVIEDVPWPGKDFVDVRLLGNQVIVRLNTRHRFYKEIWEPLKEIAETDPGSVSGVDAVKAAKRAVEGLTLMVLAYGKAMSMSPSPSDYDDLTSYWGQFIDTLMGKVSGVV